MKRNALKDIKTLTNIDEVALQKLVSITEDCLCHSVLESTLEKEPLTAVDIGIGTLYIKLEGDSIKYKFIPSESLEKGVQTTVTTKKSPIGVRATDILKKKIEAVYDGLL